MSKDFKIFLLGLFILLLYLVIHSYYELTKTSGDHKISSIKANMHTLQTILEIYSVDWYGKYPENIEQLEKEAVKRKYWKEIKNPYNSSFKSITNNIESYKVIEIDSKSGELLIKKALKGVCIYNPIKEYDEVVGFYLYGVNKNNQLIKVYDQNSEQLVPFYLSNG